LSSAPGDYDLARDQVAALLTQNNGEYVLRIGQQPSHTELFAGDITDESPGWFATPRSITDIDTLREQITKTVEEVGGKVFLKTLFLLVDMAKELKDLCFV
jgi:hypothetical protein